MPTYRVTVSIKTETPCDAQEVAEHVTYAVARWGGQYREDDDLHSSNVIQVQAVCRNHVSVYRRE